MGARIAVGVYVIVVAIGLAAVLLRTPRPTTPVYNGMQAQVSSFDVFDGNHPMFAIDGRWSRTPFQKWAAAAWDTEPWIELSFSNPTSFSRVRLVHVTHAKFKSQVARAFRLSCRSETGAESTLSVGDNDQVVSQHLLQCQDAHVLRIDFDAQSETAHRRAQLYEIEVFP